MDFFFRILEKASSELICTRLYTLNTYKMSNQCHTMYNVSSKVTSLEELQGHRHCCCRHISALRSILQNQNKTEVLPVLPTNSYDGAPELYRMSCFSYQTQQQNCVTEWRNETLQKRYVSGL